MKLFNIFEKTNLQEATSKPASSKDQLSHMKEQGSNKQQQLLLNERYGNLSLRAYKDQNWDQAIPELLILEREGCAEASVALGQYWTIIDRSRALLHFKKAADKGVAEGAWGYVALLEQPHIKGSSEWYKYCLQSAKGGCCDAMNELGKMYLAHNDYLEAFYWYQMASYYEHPQGDKAAYYTIDRWKQAGMPQLSASIDGVRELDVESATLIMRCMAQIDSFEPDRLDEFMSIAMKDNNEMMGLFLGHFFEALEDYKMAKLGYQLAAHNNSIIGMKCLGDMHIAGRGCEQNMQVAISWYKGAAADCEKTACFIIGQLEKRQSPNLAAYYFAIAIRRGYKPAYQAIMQL